MTVLPATLLTILGLGAIVVGTSTPAQAFGTVNGTVLDHTQLAEHGRITRIALQCKGEGHHSDLEGTCFEPQSLHLLAGMFSAGRTSLTDPMNFGGVGFPDNPINGLSGVSAAHCDNGDFLTGVYPRSRTQADQAITSCILWARGRYQSAVGRSEKLVGTASPYRPSLGAWVDPMGGCHFYTDGGGGDPVKCAVIAEFGSSLHTVQDFFSHSNWTDVRDTNHPEGTTNPPGLGMKPYDPAPFWNLNSAVTGISLPEGIITGCFGLNIFGQNPCLNRVHHDSLNKDGGVILNDLGVAITSAPNTPRGQVADNFRNAVRAAVNQTRTQWNNFRAELKHTYGAERGRAMACVLTHDDPKMCHVIGFGIATNYRWVETGPHSGEWWHNFERTEQPDTRGIHDTDLAEVLKRIAQQFRTPSGDIGGSIYLYGNGSTTQADLDRAWAQFSNLISRDDWEAVAGIPDWFSNCRTLNRINPHDPSYWEGYGSTIHNPPVGVLLDSTLDQTFMCHRNPDIG